MKKKILSIITAICMIATLSSITAFAESTDKNDPIDESGNNVAVTEEGDTTIAVWGKIKPLSSDPDDDNASIAVNIAWGNLKYDYSQGTWDSTTLKYENVGWFPASSGTSDKLTVKNRSNVAVDAELSFANSGNKYANINTTNVFFNEKEYTSNVTDNTLSLDDATDGSEKEQSAYLKISGTPTEMTDTTEYVRIGTITVNISKANDD